MDGDSPSIVDGLRPERSSPLQPFLFGRVAMSISTIDPQVIATVGAKAFLTQMVAAAQHLTLCTVHLFENNLFPSAMNVAADFTEPSTDWGTYAAKATTGWGAQGVDATGRAYISATPLMEWVGPAGGGGPTIYGY